MESFTVKYQYATYSGTRRVLVSDEDQAIAKVRKWCRENSSLTMAYEDYRVVRP